MGDSRLTLSSRASRDGRTMGRYPFQQSCRRILDRSLYPAGPASFARMRSPRTALLALVAFSLLFWGAAGPASSQGAGALTVTTDYELIGTTGLSGGGHVTWVLTGDEARELRAKIVGLFDEYVTFPRGFPFSGTTGLVGPNQQIDREEALSYTAYVELELEGYQRGLSGTQVGYVLVDRADLFEAGAIERSTTGLVGTNSSTATDLQIRFLFNGRTTASDTRVSLPTRAFADALHRVFSYEARQSDIASDPWPLLAEGGWHAVTIGGQAALWHGNDATGRYENNSANVMRTAPTDVAVPGIDLRFASTAWAEFTYSGRVFDGNDGLRLEALGPSNATWSVLATLADTGGAWRNHIVNLSAFLGQKVRLRLNFTSDASGNEEGFFVRNFAILAPSTYEGEIIESAAHYLIGSLSFAEPSVNGESLNLIRTPGGEILFYSSAWSSDAPPEDTIRFEIFSPFENPQVLFVIMIVAAYFISRSQEVAYDRYREAHPTVYRTAIRKAKWLHTVGKVAMGFLILLYFIPTAFFNIGLRVFVSGSAYLFLALTLALGLGFGTRAYYQQKLEQAPPPVATEGRAAGTAAPTAGTPVAHCAHCLREVLDSDRTYRCTCGSVYHLACASSLMKCSNCRKPVAVEVVGKRRDVSMRCASCGEVQTIPEDVDARTVVCEACGGRLRSLEEGKGYLLIASNPGIAFSWLRDLTKGGKQGLCLTTSAPDRLRLEYGMRGVEFIHVSAHAPQALDPKELDPTGLRPILSLSRTERSGVILYDGLEQMVNESSLGDVVRFIRKANDMAFVHGITVLARVTPGSLAESEIARLSAEFDESIDFTAKF